MINSIFFAPLNRFIAGAVLATSFGCFFQSARATGQAPANDQTVAQDREISDLVTHLSTTGYFHLKEPKERAAIEKLQKMGEHSAPAVAKMLADGHKNRKEGWIQVYRPLIILVGMGEHSKVALPDVIKALDDPQPIIVGTAAEILGNIGLAAKGAVPTLLRVSEKSPKDSELVKKAIAGAIKKIDPEAVGKAGIK